MDTSLDDKKNLFLVNHTPQQHLYCHTNRHRYREWNLNMCFIHFALSNALVRSQ